MIVENILDLIGNTPRAREILAEMRTLLALERNYLAEERTARWIQNRFSTYRHSSCREHGYCVHRFFPRSRARPSLWFAQLHLFRYSYRLGNLDQLSFTFEIEQDKGEENDPQGAWMWGYEQVQSGSWSAPWLCVFVTRLLALVISIGSVLLLCFSSIFSLPNDILIYLSRRYFFAITCSFAGSNVVADH